MTRKIILAGVLGAVLSGCVGGGDSGSSGGSVIKSISAALNNIGFLRLKSGNGATQLSGATVLEASSFTAQFADTTPDQLEKNLTAFEDGLKATAERAYDPETDVVGVFGETLDINTAELPSDAYLSTFMFGDTSSDPQNQSPPTNSAGTMDVTLSGSNSITIGNLIARSKAGNTSTIKVSAGALYVARPISWNTALIENTTITFQENTSLTMVDNSTSTAIYTTALGDRGTLTFTNQDLTVPKNFTLMLKSGSANLNLPANKLINQGAIILTGGTITAGSVECIPYGDFLTEPFLAAVQSTVKLKEDFLQPTTEWQTFGSVLYKSDLAFEGFFFMSGGNVTGTLTGNRLSFLFGGALNQSFTNNGFVFMSGSTTAMKTALSTQLSALNIPNTDPDYQLVSIVNEVIGLMGDSTPTLQATTNNGLFLMSGGEIKGTFTNNGIMAADGGTCSVKLINKGTLSVTGNRNGFFAAIQTVAGDQIPATYQQLIKTFVPTSGPQFQDITNSGTLTVDGGTFGNIQNQNGGVFVFGGVQTQGLASGNASTGDLTFDGQSRAILVTGYTLQTQAITFESPSLSVSNIEVVVTDSNKSPILSSSGSIDLRSCTISVTTANTKVIPSGTVITLAQTTGTLTFTGTLEDSTEFKIDNTAGFLKLTALHDIAAQTNTVALSATISDVGGFRPHKAGKLVGATQSSVAGATFSVAGDMNVSNGFSANNAEVQMKMGSITLTSNFTKTAGMNLSGTFAAFNAIDVAGVTLTNSVSFATKGDLKTSSFNETGFMSAVSKDLGSDGFSFTPSVSVGFSKLSDVSVQVDGYSVQGASAGAYLADFSVDAGHAFKVSGISMNVSGGISFGVKSAQSFELHNAAGQTMNATTADRNVGLSFGFTAKLDAKTSFYANAKTASYNNAKTLEVGFKF